jgi:hypothetical protein
VVGHGPEIAAGDGGEPEIDDGAGNDCDHRSRMPACEVQRQGYGALS